MATSTISSFRESITLDFELSAYPASFRARFILPLATPPRAARKCCCWSVSFFCLFSELVGRKILAKSAPIASQKLVEILESDDPIPQVNAKLQAAQTLLDRVGIAKRDKLDVTHTAASGIFIIPAKEKLIDANAEDIDIDDEEK